MSFSPSLLPFYCSLYFLSSVLTQNKKKLAPGTSSASHRYCLCLRFLQRSFNLQLPTTHFLAIMLHKSLRNPTAPPAMVYTSNPALVRIFFSVNYSKTSSKMMLHLLFTNITALFSPSYKAGGSNRNPDMFLYNKRTVEIPARSCPLLECWICSLFFITYICLLKIFFKKNQPSFNVFVCKKFCSAACHCSVQSTSISIYITQGREKVETACKNALLCKYTHSQRCSNSKNILYSFSGEHPLE